MNKDTIKIKQALEAAFSIEIGRVSELPYSSREICRHFFSDVRDRFLAALSAEQQEEAQPIGWVKSGELADCRKKRQSVNLWPIKYSDLDMPVYAAPVTVQPASKPILPDGYTAKHVDGHGWLIDPPNGSRWIAFDDTPVGDLIADLTRSATSKKASAPARDDVQPLRERLMGAAVGGYPVSVNHVEAWELLQSHPAQAGKEASAPARDMREAFEKWVTRNMHESARNFIIRRDDDYVDCYADDYIQMRWEAWQAALQAHPAQAGKEASEAAQEPLTEWLESDAGKAAMQHAGAIAAQAAQPCRDDVSTIKDWLWQVRDDGYRTDEERFAARILLKIVPKARTQPAEPVQKKENK